MESSALALAHIHFEKTKEYSKFTLQEGDFLEVVLLNKAVIKVFNSADERSLNVNQLQWSIH